MISFIELVVTIFVGILYGLLFTRTKAFLFSQTETHFLLPYILTTITRIGFLLGIGWYLLRTHYIPSILVIIVGLTAFLVSIRFYTRRA